MTKQSRKGHQRPGPNVIRNAISRARNGPTSAREADGRPDPAEAFALLYRAANRQARSGNNSWLFTFGRVVNDPSHAFVIPTPNAAEESGFKNRRAHSRGRPHRGRTLGLNRFACPAINSSFRPGMRRRHDVDVTLLPRCAFADSSAAFGVGMTRRGKSQKASAALTSREERKCRVRRGFGSVPCAPRRRSRAGIAFALRRLPTGWDDDGRSN
jgi:hypothetical protein